MYIVFIRDIRKLLDDLFRIEFIDEFGVYFSLTKISKNIFIYITSFQYEM